MRLWFGKFNEANIKIHLNTAPDVEMIRGGGFDDIVVAIGAVPKSPDIPGIEGGNVVYVTDVYGREDTLAKDVVTWAAASPVWRPGCIWRKRVITSQC